MASVLSVLLSPSLSFVADARFDAVACLYLAPSQARHAARAQARPTLLRPRRPSLGRTAWARGFGPECARDVREQSTD